VDLADGPRRACSSRVLRVLARLRFRFVVFSSFGWAKFRTVRVCRADNPRVTGGQSACSPWTVRYSRCVSGGSVAFFGQSAAQAGRSAARVRTVRAAFADSPLCPPGPGSFVPWFDSSLLSCFRMCFKESFLRLEVDP
jgi:hypothetical protein